MAVIRRMPGRGRTEGGSNLGGQTRPLALDASGGGARARAPARASQRATHALARAQAAKTDRHTWHLWSDAFPVAHTNSDLLGVPHVLAFAGTRAALARAAILVKATMCKEMQCAELPFLSVGSTSSRVPLATFCASSLDVDEREALEKAFRKRLGSAAGKLQPGETQERPHLGASDGKPARDRDCLVS